MICSTCGDSIEFNPDNGWVHSRVASYGHAATVGSGMAPATVSLTEATVVMNTVGVYTSTAPDTHDGQGYTEDEDGHLIGDGLQWTTLDDRARAVEMAMTVYYRVKHVNWRDARDHDSGKRSCHCASCFASCAVCVDRGESHPPFAKEEHAIR